MLEWLRDHDGAAPLVANIDAHAPANLPRELWWRRLARPTLRHAVKAGVVRAEAADGDGEAYRWVGEG